MQEFLPTTLVLETMSKKDVSVVKRRVIIFREFLQANNISISRSISLPAKLFNKRTTDPIIKRDK
jgi:hypothetical protein